MDLKIKFIDKCPEYFLKISQKGHDDNYTVYVDSKTELKELIETLKKYLEVKWD